MTDASRAPEPSRRPQPKYGEYATPQEQAEIVAKSMPPVSPLLVPSDHAESVPVPTGSVVRDALPPTRSRRRWDVILSLALLAYGFATVLAGFVQYSDVPALIDQVYESQGIGEFTPTSTASIAGIVIIVSNVVLFALAAWLTMRRLLARRLAFWIPLTAGVVSVAITMIAIGITIAGDPAFVSYLGGMQNSVS